MLWSFWKQAQVLDNIDDELEVADELRLFKVIYCPLFEREMNL